MVITANSTIVTTFIIAKAKIITITISVQELSITII